MGIPAVIAGLAIVHGAGLVATSYAYGMAVIVLSAFAMLNVIRLRTNNHPSTKEVPQ